MFSAVLKSQAADFIVDEVLGFELDGAGEHQFLHIEKTGTNTDEIAKLLETVYAVTSKDVGISGMKDRHAVTSQWFSVTTPQGPELMERALEDFKQDHKHARIIGASRHSRKLRRGAHSGNDFVIRLRDVQPATGTLGGTADMAVMVDMAGAVQLRIEQIVAHGFPNYIGPQRFGFGGQNLVRARQWFRQPKKRTSRQQRSLWLSAGRSAIFNAVCAARVTDGSWQSLLAGEPAVLSGTRSFFDTTDVSAEELATRTASLDIHPSAPWWGRGKPLASLACADYERDILEPFADICDGLERAGLDQERRAIRAVATKLRHQWIDKATLELSFNLPPGVFATTLLNELGLCEEPTRPRSDN